MRGPQELEDRLDGQLRSQGPAVDPKGLTRSQLKSRYNLPMSRTAAKLLEEARQLPAEELDWLIQNLLHEGDGASEEEAYAAWQKEVGKPELGYEDWFRAGVEEALADKSPDIPHEVAMKQFHHAIRRARKLKATA